MRFWYLLPVVILGGLAGLAFVGSQDRETGQLIPSLVGQQAPSVALTPLANQTVFGERDLVTGDIVFVNFWASWCGPCRTEHPHLETLAAQGFPLFGVNYRDNPAAAEAFLNELGDPFDFGGADMDARTGAAWGVYGLPETFVLDGAGRVIYRVAGPITARTWNDRVRPALAELGVTLPTL